MTTGLAVGIAGMSYGGRGTDIPAYSLTPADFVQVKREALENYVPPSVHKGEKRGAEHSTLYTWKKACQYQCAVFGFFMGKEHESECLAAFELFCKAHEDNEKAFPKCVNLVGIWSNASTSTILGVQI